MQLEFHEQLPVPVNTVDVGKHILGRRRLGKQVVARVLLQSGDKRRKVIRPDGRKKYRGIAKSGELGAICVWHTVDRPFCYGYSIAHLGAGRKRKMKHSLREHEAEALRLL